MFHNFSMTHEGIPEKDHISIRLKKQSHLGFTSLQLNTHFYYWQNITSKDIQTCGYSHVVRQLATNADLTLHLSLTYSLSKRELFSYEIDTSALCRFLKPWTIKWVKAIPLASMSHYHHAAISTTIISVNNINTPFDNTQYRGFRYISQGHASSYTFERFLSQLNQWANGITLIRPRRADRPLCHIPLFLCSVP